MPPSSTRKKNLAALAAIACVLVALAVIPGMCARLQRPYTYAPTYPEAQQAGVVEQVARVRAGLIPLTAREIHHLREPQSGRTWVRFLFDPADQPRLTAGLRRLPEAEAKTLEVRSPGAWASWWLVSSRTLSGGQGRRVQVYEAPEGHLVIDPRSSTAYFWSR